jgi:hypothetical protein
VLLSLFDNKKEDTEKLIVLGLFVIHASLGSLGVLLAHIADGPDCTKDYESLDKSRLVTRLVYLSQL